MNVQLWLRKLLGRPPGTARRTGSRRGRGIRLDAEYLENRLAPAGLLSIPPAAGIGGATGTLEIDISALNDGTHTGLAAASLAVTYPTGLFDFPLGGSAATADVSLGTVESGDPADWNLIANSTADGDLLILLSANAGHTISTTTGGSLVIITFPILLNPTAATPETINVVSAVGTSHTSIIGSNGTYTTSALGLPVTSTMTINPGERIGLVTPQNYTTEPNVTFNAPSTAALLTGATDPNALTPFVNSINGAAYTDGTADTLASGAVLTVNMDGSFSYVPATNFVGVDTFTFAATDSNNNASNIAAANITLTPTVRLAPSTITGKPGDHVSLQVVLDNADQGNAGGLASFNLALTYTPFTLDITSTSITPGSALPTDWTFTPNTYDPTARIGYPGVIGYAAFGSGTGTDVVHGTNVVLATIDITLANAVNQVVPLQLVPLIMTQTGNVSTSVTGPNSSFTINPLTNSFVTGQDTDITITDSSATPLMVSPTTLPNYTRGMAYNQTITASGGTAPYTFGLSGSLPPGLTLNPSTGVLSGTPTTFGTYSFSVYAADSTGDEGSQAYTLSPSPPPPPFPPPLPNGDFGTPYNQTIVVTGGLSPYTFAVSNGTLPSGLTLNSRTGVLSGVPTTAGSFTFTVMVTDSATPPETASIAYTVTINMAVAITTTSLPNGNGVGTPYNQTIAASGGITPYTFTRTSGTPPTGLTLSSMGVITGTPTTVGSYTFTVTATDAVGASATQSYTITINPGPLSEYIVTVQGSSTAQAGKGFLVSVQAADQFGNPVSSYSGPNTLTASVSPASTASNFPTTVSINSTGLGLFLADLQKVGTYTISVASGALTGSASPVTVTPGPAVQLDFVAQPVDTPSFVTLPPVTVQVVDLYGNVVTTDNTDLVTMGIASGQGGFCPCSTPTVIVQNGVATFSNLRIVKPGTYQLSATVPGLYTGPFSASFSVLPLEVVPGSFVTSPSGFSVSFNTPFLVNATTPVLYGKGVGTNAPVPTVTLTGPAGLVAGTLLVNSASNSLTFVATDTTSNVNTGTPLLPAGVYTAIIHGTAAGDGLQALHSAGGFLNNGSDFTATFTVSTPASDADVLWMPATADGPRQSLQAPGNNQENQPGLLASGYPIYIHDTTGLVTSVNLTFNYNPALLTVTGVTSNSAVSGSSFTLLPTSTPGHAILQYSGSPSSASKLLKETTIPAALGDVPLGFINATVPVSSKAQPIYGAADLITLTNVAINPTTMDPGGSIPSVDAEAVHLVAYVGDADGNGGYSSSDAILMTRVVDQTDSGFAAYLLVDPVIVADTDGCGFVDADAGLQANEAGVGVLTANLPVPPIPSSGLVITTPVQPYGDVGLAYSQTIGTAGGTTPVFFSWTGNLPTGLTLSSTGVLSGTAMVQGTFTFTVTATDSATPTPATASLSYTITVNPAVTISTTMLGNGYVGSPYTQTISATGGFGPVSFSENGTLPTGLTLNSNSGVLSGTPTLGGVFNFTMTARDTLGGSGSQSYTVTIWAFPPPPPTILANGEVGVAYSQTITATGGTAPYTFTTSAGTLPNGLTLRTIGILSGTPTTAGTFTLTITVTDSATPPDTATQRYTVTIISALAITTTSLPNDMVGAAYSQTINTVGGTPPVTFSTSSGTLPTGLTLNSSTGVISGTPTTAGSFIFTIKATDSASPADTATQTYTFGGGCGSIMPSMLPNGELGVAYGQTISVTGGTPPVTFSTSAGMLPVGLTLNSSTGVLNGTPTTAGAYTFTIMATDSASLPDVVTQSYTVTINPAVMIFPTSLAGFDVGVPYSQTISATGGSGPYMFSYTGTLPTGLTLNSSTGVVSGTPTILGSFTFTVAVTDTLRGTAAQTYTVRNMPPPVPLSPTTLPNGEFGVAYSQTISATGGTAPYTFSTSAGTLPIGLSLNSTRGVLFGTPTMAGIYTFTVQATDSATPADIATQSYTVTINPAVAITTTTLPNSASGMPYCQTISTTGGTGPYTFTKTSGIFPTGLTLNSSTGVLCGTPTTGGTYTFAVTATDTLGGSASQNYTVQVILPCCGPLNPTMLPNGDVGIAYGQTITATGGTPPITFATTAGTIPTGLILATTGVLSGTPTAMGTFTFIITATDSASQTSSQSYTVTINPVLMIITTILPNGTVGVAYTQTITATGGSGSYMFSTTAGTLPPGLTLSSIGVLSGTPTTAGNFPFVVITRDTLGGVASQNYTVTIVAPMGTMLSRRTMPNGNINQPVVAPKLSDRAIAVTAETTTILSSTAPGHVVVPATLASTNLSTPITGLVSAVVNIPAVWLVTYPNSVAAVREAIEYVLANQTQLPQSSILFGLNGDDGSSDLDGQLAGDLATLVSRPGWPDLMNNQTTASALVLERAVDSAALDQYFAETADGTDQILEDQ